VRGDVKLSFEFWNSMMKASMTKAEKMLTTTMTTTRWKEKKNSRDHFEVTCQINFKFG